MGCMSASGRLWASGLVVVLTVSLVSRQSLAQSAFDLDAPMPSPPAAGGTEQAVVARYWQLGRVRWFGAAMVEAGYAYARPRLAFGYGQPYWRWAGLETYPLVGLDGLGHYGGLAAALPGFSLRMGGRYSYPFLRTLLPPADSYDREDLDLRKGPRAEYLAMEAEAVATVPVLTGSAFAVASGYRVGLVPDGFFLYEENLRAVMKPPYIWRGRVGYLLTLGRDGAIRVGPVAEAIGLPGRDEVVVRGGLLGAVLINAHLEAQVSMIPVLRSPDSIGLAGGDLGQLGIRFRWATGSTPDPERVRELVRGRGAPR